MAEECQLPAVFSHAVTPSNGIKLAWNSTPYDAWFIVEYRAANQSSWQRISVGGLECQLTGLQTNTTYLWRVGVWCNGTEQFANVQYFTTPNTSHIGNGNGSQNTGVGEGLLYMSIPYPNPSRGNFSFDLHMTGSEALDKPQELVVVSVAGQEVYRTVVLPSEQSTVSITLPEYVKSGTYLLKVGSTPAQRIQVIR
jgi:hypothetical protein